jgi:hypothetical protein
MMKTCIACSMPMEKKEDFAMSDESKDYCVYCARSDGTMKSYDETLEGMTGFAMKTYGLDEESARKTAKDMMSNLPAWKS